MMQDLLRQLRQNKLLVGLVIFLSLAVGLAYWWTNIPHRGSTGGSGKPEKNAVVITGWNKKTKDGVEVGSIISDRQQQQMRQLLSEKIAANAGDFEYLQPVIQDGIESVYDKKTNIDQTKLSVVATVNGKQLKFSVVLDHNANTAKLELQDDKSENRVLKD